MVGGRPLGLPARQGRVAGVGKQEFQRRRFDVAVAKGRASLALLRTHAVETFGEIRVFGVAEKISAVDQRVGDDRNPILQIGGSLHHHCLIAGPVDVKAKAIGRLS